MAQEEWGKGPEQNTITNNNNKITWQTERNSQKKQRRTTRVEGKAGKGGNPKPKEEHFKKQVQLESSAAKRNSKIATGSWHCI